jgi:hypothetical protein
MKWSSILPLSLALVFAMACNSEPSGRPTQPKPFNGIPGVIEVFEPDYNEEICVHATGVKSKVIVEGKARGWWYWEATFPVTVRDEHGQPLGEFYATAKTDWMTEEFVEFQGVIEFREPQSTQGSIEFHRSDPSGGLEGGQLNRPKSYKMPVRFKRACTPLP